MRDNLKKTAGRTRSTGGLAGRRRRRAEASKQGEPVADDLLRPSEVELLRTLWETGMWSYAALAEKFEVSPAVAKGIAHFKIHR